MSLLNKFSHVEIKADARISEADKAVGLREQEAFDKSGPALEQLADLYDALTGSVSLRTMPAVLWRHGMKCSLTVWSTISPVPIPWN